MRSIELFIFALFTQVANWHVSTMLSAVVHIPRQLSLQGLVCAICYAAASPFLSPVAAARAWNALPQHIRNAPFFRLPTRTEDRSVPVVIP